MSMHPMASRRALVLSVAFSETLNVSELISFLQSDIIEKHVKAKEKEIPLIHWPSWSPASPRSLSRRCWRQPGSPRGRCARGRIEDGKIQRVGTFTISAIISLPICERNLLREKNRPQQSLTTNRKYLLSHRERCRPLIHTEIG